MRRCVVALVAVALVASLPGPAEAGTLRIRHDPNDSPAKEDIRRVVSDLSASTVYLRIDTWQRFRRAYFIVRFDSSGDRGYDRVLEIYKGPRGFTCLLEKAFRGSTDPGEVVGERRASRPSKRSVACKVPRSWFPRIQRAVRFYVVTLGNDEDRAPNRGLYRWL